MLKRLHLIPFALTAALMPGQIAMAKTQSETPAVIARRQPSAEMLNAYTESRYGDAWAALSRDIATCLATPRTPDDCLNLLNIGAAQAKNLAADPVSGELYARAALAIADQHFRADSIEVAWSLFHLAESLNAQGKYAEAEEFGRRALRIYERALPDGDLLFPIGLFIYYSLNELAANLHAQGKYAEAEALLRRAVEMREIVLPTNDPDVALSLKNLADVFQDQGKYTDAEALYHQALTVASAGLVPDHPDLLLYRDNFGKFAMRRIGTPVVALDQYRVAAMAIARRTRNSNFYRWSPDEQEKHGALTRYIEAAWRTAHPNTPATSTTEPVRGANS